MPKYTLLFLGRDQDLESGSNDEMRRMYASVGTWWEDLEKKGVIKEGAQLGPQRSATAVRRVNGKMTVREGPLFASDERRFRAGRRSRTRRAGRRARTVAARGHPRESRRLAPGRGEASRDRPPAPRRAL